MKIAHLISTFPPYKGGMGNTCYFQVRELINLGHDVTVFTPKYDNEILRPSSPRPSSGQAGQELKIKYLKPLLKYGNAGFIPQIFCQLKKFDLVQLHYPFVGGAEIIWLWKKTIGRKKPLVIFYHMDLVGRGPFGFVFKIYNKFFAPLIVKAADKILVSSLDYFQNSKISRIKNIENKVIELPFGIDSQKFYPRTKNQNLLEKHRLQLDDQIILFVGGLDKAHYFKGIDVLIKAFRKIINNYQISKVRLLIVGDGDLRPTYEKLAADLGVGEKIIFAGSVDDEHLADYYNLADIFVLPSIDRSEAFGMVTLEAMACAKPIIVSNLPGPRTLVQKNINGLLVKPGDINDLIEKIKFLLENIEQSKGWGRAGRKIVEEKYNWAEIVKKLDNIYYNLYNLYKNI